MEIQNHIYILALLPAIAFILFLLFPRRNERLISNGVFAFMVFQFLLCIWYVLDWILRGCQCLDEMDLLLYERHGYAFHIDFHFDRISAVFLIVGTFITLLIARYSRYYMHRESGYKRFFNTLLFFYLGYTVAVLSGNFETLFIGWECLGVSSFLLISFYRDRYLPVRNAVKVFSIYRVGDVGLILAMWLSHHLWHKSITFQGMAEDTLSLIHLQEHSLVGVVLALMILLTSAAKSAQLPFTSWLPRAMEGPTPSSAIFYGALSVHLGVFLLMRTYSIWEYQFSVRLLIGALGLITALVATGIARVQSSIKSQVAYASAAQIGLMYVELAFGWIDLALIHFAGNAFLRSYQLLVSPSVVSYLIREQFFTDPSKFNSVENTWPQRLRITLYILCVREFYLDDLLYRVLWNPLKWLGNQLSFFGSIWVIIPAIGFFAWGMYESVMGTMPEGSAHLLSLLFACIGLVLVLKSFTERHKVFLAWSFILLNHLSVALAVSFNEHYDVEHNAIYLSGIVLSWIIGWIVLRFLKNKHQDLDLHRFHGLVNHFPMLAMVFFLSCLGMSGFPITPSFIGEDLIFSHIHSDQVVLAFVCALSLIMDGLAIMRVFARVFFGPDVKSMYSNAYRSS
jgi:NADH:ubiquinone oxidoreductase subunit 5 (subunit L)/multisubunit Na+/H+ antiporter MnhA subunit